jgi:exosortase C (VPDSG-CTERM-specific)
MGLPLKEFAPVSDDASDWQSRNPRESRIASSESTRRRIWLFALFTLLLLCCFSRPIYNLVRFAVHSHLYSHIILIPFISLYLIWINRHQLVLDAWPSRKLALTFITGAGIVAIAFSLRASGGIQTQDYLAAVNLAFLTILWAGCLFIFGITSLRAVIFPLLFLLFIVPFPMSLERHLETFFQVSSAAAAHVFFQISGTPVLQQGTAFQLPGFSFEVAPECSGIHSSMVLFITGFVAGHLLLRNLWAKAFLVLFVVPLAIIRNGIRIFIIGQLCVHVGPDMIHSYIHRRGGPIFFAGSLIPFFLLLFFLMKVESNRHTLRSNGRPNAANPSKLPRLP